MTAKDHAELADRILSTLWERQEQFADRHRDEVKRMHDAASGVTAAMNRESEYSLRAAQAHAMTALALHFVHMPLGGDAIDADVGR